MIFSKQSIENIKSGKKTGTTRVTRWWWLKGSTTIAVQPGRGKHGVGSIRLSSVEKVYCEGDETPQARLLRHAKRYFVEEGFDNPTELYCRFIELKLDKKLQKHGELLYYEFEYLGAEKPKYYQKRL